LGVAFRQVRLIEGWYFYPVDDCGAAMECNECGATVSDKAADCPQCGASLRDPTGGIERDGATGVDGAGPSGTDEAGPDRTQPAVPGDDESTEPDDHDSATDTDTGVGDGPGRGEPAETDDFDTGTTPATADASDVETETGADPGTGAETRADPGTGTETGAETETGWEAAGPPPDQQETHVEGGAPVGSEESAVGDRGAATGVGEPPASEGTELDAHERGGGNPGFGGETGTAGGQPEVPDRSRETGGAGGDTGTERDSGPGSGTMADLVEGIRELPFLTGPIAGLVTAAVLIVLSVVVAVLVPDSGLDTVSLGGLVLLDLHFATSLHVTPDLFERFDVADPRPSSLGLLYLLPPLFCYTAAKFVAAYNVDETTPLPLAGVAGALVTVGYFPAILVAVVLAPGGRFSIVSLPAAILLAGIAYPVVFGFLGGLAAGTFSGSERRVGTLYAFVAFFLAAIGSFLVTLPALDAGDLGLLPQVHAALFTVVAANGFSLGSPSAGALILLGYPLLGGVVFAAGFLRAWNASDVEEPLRGAAKGLSPVATYFVLLGVVATLLPLVADPWVVRELGFDFVEALLVQGLVDGNLATIGRYVTVVFVGTLVYAGFLGGLGGTVAGAVRYSLSEDN
jgi:hypothetical protein